jgi:hypothetical protein
MEAPAALDRLAASLRAVHGGGGEVNRFSQCKDRYHLVEVLKRATPGKVSDVVKRVRRMDPSYLVELERLVRAAEEEKGQESW